MYYFTLDEVENCLAPLRTDLKICGFATAAIVFYWK